MKHIPAAIGIVDSVDSEEEDFQPYPIGYLNSLKAGGLPLARLALKVGCPVMLLRNLDPFIGLCNGTWLVVTEIGERVLKCRIIRKHGVCALNLCYPFSRKSPHTTLVSPIPSMTGILYDHQ